MVKSGQGKLAKSPGMSKPRAKRIGATLRGERAPACVPWTVHAATPTRLVI